MVIFDNLTLYNCKIIVNSASFGKPGVDRTTKPSSLLSPSIHSRLGLRTVVIPKKLESHFFTLSQRNTDKNIETCGILAGKLVSIDKILLSSFLMSC